eukprot:5592089-Pleurochrysis_carterae.AAC.3
MPYCKQSPYSPPARRPGERNSHNKDDRQARVAMSRGKSSFVLAVLNTVHVGVRTCADAFVSSLPLAAHGGEPTEVGQPSEVAHRYGQCWRWNKMLRAHDCLFGQRMCALGPWMACRAMRIRNVLILKCQEDADWLRSASLLQMTNEGTIILNLPY